jgi:ArsR family transcriptional regulator, arsenate/arsenite/antimonite-responsive transcriptional repressor / arsenate reductase (thioredoxin)
MAGPDLRWRLLSELARSDLRVRELVTLTGQPQSLVSYHLRQLRASGLVSVRRSSYDGRDTYYHLDLARCAESLAAAGAALHPGLTAAASASTLTPSTPRDLLFMCTGNSARSQMAEALARRHSRGHIRAVSAGSSPKPVHHNTARVMAEYGVVRAKWQSKHFSQFAGRQFHYVITLCDRVREVCPQFPGNPRYIHWSIADPAASGDNDEATLAAFQATAADIDVRIGYLLTAVATMPDRPPASAALPGPFRRHA